MTLRLSLSLRLKLLSQDSHDHQIVPFPADPLALPSQSLSNEADLLVDMQRPLILRICIELDPVKVHGLETVRQTPLQNLRPVSAVYGIVSIWGLLVELTYPDAPDPVLFQTVQSWSSSGARPDSQCLRVLSKGIAAFHL